MRKIGVDHNNSYLVLVLTRLHCKDLLTCIYFLFLLSLLQVSNASPGVMWRALDDHQWAHTQKPLCLNKKVMDLIISSTLDLRFLILRWSIFCIPQLRVKLTTYPLCPRILARAPLVATNHRATELAHI